MTVHGVHELIDDVFDPTWQLPSSAEVVAVSEVGDTYGSPYRVTEVASASLGAATLAVACLHAERTGATPCARLDLEHAAVAFHSERILEVPGDVGADLWDPIAGNYATADGWVRLHTNVTAHRAAALRALGVAADSDLVAAACRLWSSQSLEEAVVSQGGVAAAMRTPTQWEAHPQAAAVASQPVVGLDEVGDAPALPRGPVVSGVRVLDLTRVIAGPVAGRFLASHGADVIRVDAPLDDGVLVEIDTSFGKRRVDLDLRDRSDRVAFDRLVAEADVILEAFRPGALSDLGYDDATLRRLRPGLVVGHLSAYGSRGPLSERRGFDSVVQVATGIAHTCGFDQESGPGALPAQALDHASGYLLAAGVVAALRCRRVRQTTARVEVSLARTGAWLTGLGVRPGKPSRTPDAAAVKRHTATTLTSWGSVRHVAAIGTVGGRRARWATGPVPRGTHQPVWHQRCTAEAEP